MLCDRTAVGISLRRGVGCRQIGFAAPARASPLAPILSDIQRRDVPPSLTDVGSSPLHMIRDIKSLIIFTILFVPLVPYEAMFIVCAMTITSPTKRHSSLTDRRWFFPLACDTISFRGSFWIILIPLVAHDALSIVCARTHHKSNGLSCTHHVVL